MTEPVTAPVAAPTPKAQPKQRRARPGSGYLKLLRPGVWSLAYNGKPDPVTGKRKQKTATFHNSPKLTAKEQRAEAQAELARLIAEVATDDYKEPCKLTVAEWLDKWLKQAVKPTKNARTVAVYENVIRTHVKPSNLGPILLTALRRNDVTEYYASIRDRLSPATVGMHAAVLSAAMKSAVLNDHIPKNPVQFAEGKPPLARTQDITANCFDADEARKLLAAARETGPRVAAFYSLALDSGARLAELCGLCWTDFNLDTGKMTISHQLLSAKLTADGAVVLGPTKTKKSRTVDLGAETVRLLIAHRLSQNEQKLRSGKSWKDTGLVFTREVADLYGNRVTLGAPLGVDTINCEEFRRLCKRAGIRKISFHGLRHSSATLMLQAGVPVKIVSERLGHSKTTMTMDVYQHVLPSMGRSAADLLGQVLHGTGT